MPLAILAAMALQASAEPLQPPYDWIRTPNARDLTRAYPDGAAKRNVEANTTLTCRFTDTGALTECQVTLEDPPGFGFGEAALRLAPLFQARPKDGLAGATAKIPIRWLLPRDPGSARLNTVMFESTGPSGQAEVSCQVFTGRLGNCFVLKAEPKSLESIALKAAEGVPPGDIPLGLRFIMPMEFKTKAAAKP